MRVKEESEKVVLKLNIQKTKIMTSGPMTSWEIEKGTLLHCWWECKLVQPLWRTVWRFLKKLQIEMFYFTLEYSKLKM